MKNTWLKIKEWQEKKDSLEDALDLIDQEAYKRFAEQHEEILFEVRKILAGITLPKCGK